MYFPKSFFEQWCLQCYCLFGVSICLSSRIIFVNLYAAVNGKVVPVHAFRAYNWNGGISPCVLNFCTRWVVNFTPRTLQPGKRPLCPLEGATDRVHILRLEQHLDPDNIWLENSNKFITVTVATLLLLLLLLLLLSELSITMSSALCIPIKFRILIVIFMYFCCCVRSVLYILFHCVVLCIVLCKCVLY